MKSVTITLDEETAASCPWYSSTVSSKLSLANPYLRDPVVRQRNVFTSVSSSSAVEGIHAPFRRTGAVAAATGAASRGRAKRLSKNRLNRAKA